VRATSYSLRRLCSGSLATLPRSLSCEVFIHSYWAKNRREGRVFVENFPQTIEGQAETNPSGFVSVRESFRRVSVRSHFLAPPTQFRISLVFLPNCFYGLRGLSSRSNQQSEVCWSRCARPAARQRISKRRYGPGIPTCKGCAWRCPIGPRRSASSSGKPVRARNSRRCATGGPRSHDSAGASVCAPESRKARPGRSRAGQEGQG